MYPSPNPLAAVWLLAKIAHRAISLRSAFCFARQGAYIISKFHLFIDIQYFIAKANPLLTK